MGIEQLILPIIGGLAQGFSDGTMQKAKAKQRENERVSDNVMKMIESDPSLLQLPEMRKLAERALGDKETVNAWAQVIQAKSQYDTFRKQQAAQGIIDSGGGWQDFMQQMPPQNIPNSQFPQNPTGIDPTGGILLSGTGGGYGGGQGSQSSSEGGDVFSRIIQAIGGNSGGSSRSQGLQESNLSEPFSRGQSISGGGQSIAQSPGGGTQDLTPRSNATIKQAFKGKGFTVRDLKPGVRVSTKIDGMNFSFQNQTPDVQMRMMGYVAQLLGLPTEGPWPDDDLVRILNGLNALDENKAESVARGTARAQQDPDIVEGRVQERVKTKRAEANVEKEFVWDRLKEVEEATRIKREDEAKGAPARIEESRLKKMKENAMNAAFAPERIEEARETVSQTAKAKTQEGLSQDALNLKQFDAMRSAFGGKQGTAQAGSTPMSLGGELGGGGITPGGVGREARLITPDELEVAQQAAITRATNRERPLEDTAATKLDMKIAVRQSLARAKKFFSEDFIGGIKGTDWMTDFRQRQPAGTPVLGWFGYGPVGDKETRFINAVAYAQDVVKRVVSGLVIPQQEKTEILQFLMKRTSGTPEAFMADMDEVQIRAEDAIDRYALLVGKGRGEAIEAVTKEGKEVSKPAETKIEVDQTGFIGGRLPTPEELADPKVFLQLLTPEMRQFLREQRALGIIDDNTDIVPVETIQKKARSKGGYKLVK